MMNHVSANKSPFTLLLPLAAALLLALSACNTIEGAGKDVEAAGEAVSDTARETKEEISD